MWQLAFFKIKPSFKPNLKKLQTLYLSILSFLAQPRDFICCCTKEEKVLIPNILPDFYISPIQCTYNEATIACKFHVACAACLHACSANMLWQLTFWNKYFCYRYIVIWYKNYLESALGSKYFLLYNILIPVDRTIFL